MFSNEYLNGTMGKITDHKSNHTSEVDIWSEDNPSNTYYSHLTGAGLSNKNEKKGGNTRVALSYQNFDFVRISDITLGYNFPNPVLDELGVSRFRIYGQVQNPFIFTDVVTLDPEYNSGTYADGLPSSTFLIGVNLNF